MKRSVLWAAQGLWALAVLGALMLGGWATAQAAQAQEDTITLPSPTAGQRSGNFVGVAPTEVEAEQAFHAAQQRAIQQAKGLPEEARAPSLPPLVISGSTLRVSANPSPTGSTGVALEDVRLVLDVEDATLAEIMQTIVTQAAAYTGPWTIKWRLKPESQDLLNERVNLTAEGKFGEFVTLLTERLKNLTGTQLFVTVFHASRTILVSDTFY